MLLHTIKPYIMNKLQRGEKVWEIENFHTWSDKHNPKYPKFDIINSSSKVFSIGSCFAEYVSFFLKSKEIDCKHFPDTYHFNPISIEQELISMFENNTDLTENIIENNGFFYNTVRKPSLKFNTFELAKKYATNIKNTALEQMNLADTIIITLGGIETWKNLKSNKTCLTIPYPELFNDLKKDLFNFEILTFEDVKKSIINQIYIINKYLPNRNIIFTVSPNMMNFTCSDKDITYSTSQSKSILRSAIGEIVSNKDFDNIYYFHSYELVLYSPLRNDYLNKKGHANELAINHVMKNFLYFFSHKSLNNSISYESLDKNASINNNFYTKLKFKNYVVSILSFLGIYKFLYKVYMLLR